MNSSEIEILHHEPQFITRVTYPLAVRNRGEPAGRLQRMSVHSLSTTMLDLATARILSMMEVFGFMGVRLDLGLRIMSVIVCETREPDAARGWSPSTNDADWRYLSGRLGVAAEYSGLSRDLSLRAIVAAHLSDPVDIPVWFLPD
ncbi:hypothetical protein VOI32_03630 [Paraburkholderia caribensis]|uniref:Uncharacterized protein n=2 Tax=Paraburkholderia caribensis TaxID=75105 RepID=A0ABV0DPH9_9BURK|nr:hypothetical protein [Paraburkholderia caribensis]MCO4878233.1 hypothetical protein [Paraburkholderia caribensis]